MASKAKLIATYRTLLQSEETLGHLDETLKLCEDVLGARVKWGPAGLVEVQRIGRAQKDNDEIFSRLSEIRAFEEPTFQRANLRRQHRAIGVLGMFQIHRLAGEFGWPIEHWGLFTDSCLLLFHQAYYALLPTVVDEGFSEILLSGLRRFAYGCLRASDRYQLLGLCEEAEGNQVEAGGFYEEALRATHSDEHEYMTVLQGVWAHYVSQGMYRQAFEVLIVEGPRVPRVSLDEHALLMRETVGYVTKSA